MIFRDYLDRIDGLKPKYGHLKAIHDEVLEEKYYKEGILGEPFEDFSKKSYQNND